MPAESAFRPPARQGRSARIPENRNVAWRFRGCGVCDGRIADTSTGAVGTAEKWLAPHWHARAGDQGPAHDFLGRTKQRAAQYGPVAHPHRCQQHHISRAAGKMGGERRATEALPKAQRNVIAHHRGRHRIFIPDTTLRPSCAAFGSRGDTRTRRSQVVGSSPEQAAICLRHTWVHALPPCRVTNRQRLRQVVAQQACADRCSALPRRSTSRRSASPAPLPPHCTDPEHSRGN
jgi:hypothetical protein